MELAPNKILEKFRDNSLDKKSAIEQLLALIENSTSFKTRLRGIKILSEIWKMNEKIPSLSNIIFNVFENLLISDSNEKIRNSAALFLNTNFNNIAYKPMKWALHNDDSPLVLESILNSIVEFLQNLKKDEEKSYRLFILQELQDINDIDFKIKIQEYIFSSQNNPISDNITILMNYYALTFLKKVIWRVKYEIEDCRVIQLDFLFKNLTNIPEAVKYLTSLKKLGFRYNQLTTLPQWISNLNNLESINLNINSINKLPDSFGNLINLRKLWVYDNKSNDSSYNSVGLGNELIVLSKLKNKIPNLKIYY